jgi:hypothetical protein
MPKKPSTQLIADWVVQSVSSDDWRPLKEVCFEAIKKFAVGCSDDFAYELVDENLFHIAERLRDIMAEVSNDGEFLTFTIDNESDPYIKSLKGARYNRIDLLQKVDSKHFEDICSEILINLKGSSSVIGSPNDGGIDFVCFDLVPFALDSSLLLPLKTKCVIIGQAKRYKAGHYVTEKELRDFVGAACQKLQEMQVSEKIALFTPIILAFWTSSDFSPGARKYAKQLGIWFMNGWTMIDYLDKYDIPLDKG